MSLNRTKHPFGQPHLRLIAVLGVIVPRRLRADWRQEWETELQHREQLLAQWDRLDWRNKLNLVRRSLGAFWDALWLQTYRWEDDVVQDVRYALRMLAKQPGFTLISVITLALGIGANTAIFSVINAVLLRPLPYGDAGRLVMVGHSWKGDLPGQISSLNYRDCRDQNHVFAQTALVKGWGANLIGQDKPEWLRGLEVSAGFFSTLEVQPSLGRSFAPEEDSAGRDHVVILGHSLWQRRFAGDPQILGRSITLDDKSYTVVGVLPESFRFYSSNNIEIVKPGAPSPEMSKHFHRNFETFYMIGRLSPDIDFEQAHADMRIVAGQIREQNPGWYPPESQWGLAARPLQDAFYGKLHSPLFVLWGAVGFVLLIACANVANLSLARAASRRREFSVRLAVGATRFRLVRQLLTESLLLSLLGGSLGLVLALWGIPGLVSLEPTRVFQTVDVKADGSVLWFSLGVSIVTGLMCGLLPAVRYSKSNLSEALKEGRSSSETVRLTSPKNLLVMTEVALSMTLLIGGGLMVRSLDKVLRVDPGFEPQGLLAFYISLPEFRYKTAEQINGFYQQAFANIKAIPGVEAVGSTDNPPMTKSLARNIFAVEGRTSDSGPRPSATISSVTPEYFQAMKIPLLSGRYFTERDVIGAPDVLIIDELLALRQFAGQNPLGRRISIGKAPWREIIGVVGHVKHDGLDEGAGDMQCYYPTFQGEKENGAAVIIRTKNDPLALIPPIQDVIGNIDGDQPIFGATTMTRNLSEMTAQRRFLVLLLCIFAGTALALAAIGLYGVIAYSVGQRTHEIGIRMALGAQVADVLKLIMGHGVKLILIGVAIGLSAALALTRLLRELLFEVSPTDPVTFLTVSLLLIAVALLAGYLPARRATKVNPIVALRHE